MRPLISLLLLACFAWTQAMVADCPMAPAPSGQAEHAAASAPSHHGPHAPAPTPAAPHGEHRHPSSPAQHLAGACGVVMACGTAAAPALAAALAAPDAPRPPALAAGRDAYASPTLSTDPPPPRSALRS